MKAAPLVLDVLSIQSQVVYGCVGNNVAVPELGAAQLRVASVPTVVFSNTPHYASCHGGAIPTDWFAGYLDDLEQRGALAQLRAVLVGYLGSPSQAEVLGAWLRKRLAVSPDLTVVVDPVLGDHDHGIYVDAGLIDAYRAQLLPLATGATPNSFELEVLTGCSAPTMDEVVESARTLLKGRMQWCVVTSAAPQALQGQMQLAVVTASAAHAIRHPAIAINAKGTGDLFSAALTANLLRGMHLQPAAETACRRVYAVLQHTQQSNSAELLLGPTPTILENALAHASTHHPA